MNNGGSAWGRLSFFGSASGMNRVLVFAIGVAAVVAVAIGYRIYSTDEPVTPPALPSQPVADDTAVPLPAPEPAQASAPIPSREPETEVQPAAAISQENVRVAGVVVESETSRPIAGARVVAFQGDDLPGELTEVFGSIRFGDTGTFLDDEFETKLWNHVVSGPHKRLSEIEVGSDGRFELLLPKGENQYLVAEADGFAVARVEIESVLENVRIAMLRAGMVFGRVVDADTGAPLRGVNVTAEPNRSWSDRMLDFNADEPSTGETNDRGEYTIDGITPGAYRVRADGRSMGYLAHQNASAIVNVEGGVEHEAAELRLERGAMIYGLVTDREGNPVSSAQFDVRSTRANMFEMATEFGEMGEGSWSTIESDGSYRIGAFEYGGEYLVVASSGEFAPSSQTVRTADGRDTGPVDFVLAPGGAITGFAYTEDGEPAGQHGITFRPQGAEPFGDPLSDFTQTEENGFFRFENVPDGLFQVASMNSYDGNSKYAVGVEMRNGRDVTDLTLTVPESPFDLDYEEAITGTVVDANNRPVVGIEVRASEVGGTPDDSVVTDENGAFEFSELIAMFGGGFTLEAIGEQGYKQLKGVQPGSAVRLKLGQSAIVRGVVVNSNGEAVADCSVSLDSEQQNMMDMFPFQSEESITTGADGTFEFVNMKPGAYIVTAKTRTQGFGKSRSINVGDGELVDGVRVELAAGGRVAGRVFDPDRRPVAGAQVLLMAQDNGMMGAMADMMPEGMAPNSGSATTDDRGAYTIPNVEPGYYSIVAKHSGFAKSTLPNVSIDSGATLDNVDLFLTIGGGASGVFAVDGVIKPNATLQLIGPGGMRMVTTDDEGRFEVTGLSAGRYVVMSFDLADMSDANGLGAMSQLIQQQVEVVDGQMTMVDFAQREGVAVTGNLAALGLAEGALVRLRPPGGMSLADLDLSDPFNSGMEFMMSMDTLGEVGADGSFSIDNVEPGSYVLEVYQEPDPSAFVPDETASETAFMEAFMPVLVYEQAIEVGEEALAIEMGAQPAAR
jgi:protocatechuate 3,4-dioxygenase beta subunit